MGKKELNTTSFCKQLYLKNFLKNCFIPLTAFFFYFYVTTEREGGTINTLILVTLTI